MATLTSLPVSPATKFSSDSCYSSEDYYGGKRVRRSSWQTHLPLPVQGCLGHLARFMDGPVVVSIIVVATLVSIFLQDIKALFLWCLFLLELLLNCLCHSDYFLSFFFWVDVVSAFSLVQDIPWLWEPMFGLHADSSDESQWAATAEGGLSHMAVSDRAAEVDRVRHVSAATAKWIRLVSFLKLVRLGRIAKLFDLAQRSLGERVRARRRQGRAAAAGGGVVGGGDGGGGGGGGGGGVGDDSHPHAPPPTTIHADDYTQSSQVGNALSEETTRKVVLLVLVMMLGIPLLQNPSEDHVETFVLGELNWMASYPGMLGTVTARLEADNVTLTPLRSNETEAERAKGATLVELSSSALAAMLESYDPQLGQAYLRGDPFEPQSPLLNVSYIGEVVGPAHEAVALHALSHADRGMQGQFEWALGHFDDTVLYVHVRGKYWRNEFATPGLFETRMSEMEVVEEGEGPGGRSFGIFSTRSDVLLIARNSILRTLTVFTLLTVGALAFQHNNKRMVIEPIERMVATIVQLQKNPLARAVMDDEAGGGGAGGGGADMDSGEAQAHAERKGEKRRSSSKRRSASAPFRFWWWIMDRCCSPCRNWGGGSGSWGGGGDGSGTGGPSDSPSSSSTTSTETQMLERTLEKLTGLLQVGFGEAGARMIQKCMNANPEGDLDPLVDGTRIQAIFGFCDIRRFTDATECLKEEVMVYVNEIASIVHSHVSALEGFPNKNVGDAFLVVWRLKPFGTPFDTDDLFQINEKQPQYIRDPLSTLQRRRSMVSQDEKDFEAQASLLRSERGRIQRAKQASASVPPVVRPLSPLTLVQLSVQADKAVVAFLRIIVDLDASATLRKYEAHPSIVDAFGEGNFAVELGFGLHCGWAIEGPIGSRYKIDASYLSAHVNLCEALQDLTKEYGTPLLVSGEFYTLLSPYLKSFLRRVDVVRVAGRDVPLNLYAFDIHPEALRSVIAHMAPLEYDRDAEIEVLELKPSFFHKVRAATSSSSSSKRNSVKVERGSHIPAPLPAAAAAADRDVHDGDDDGDEDDESDLDDDDDYEEPDPFDPMASPLSPGPVRRVPDVLEAHPLFLNPYLNPHSIPFESWTYSGSTRRAIHHSSPIATHHLVYNFRLQVLQCGIPYAFHDAYAAGLELYLDGQWPEARLRMLEAEQLWPEDQATKVILRVMAKHHFVAPADWAGWHDA